jgi:hypothetical protein
MSLRRHYQEHETVTLTSKEKLEFSAHFVLFADRYSVASTFGQSKVMNSTRS